MEKNKTLKLKDAIVIVAKMGGYFGRKPDDDPGFITIWRGMRKLSEIVETIKIIREKDKTYGYF